MNALNRDLLKRPVVLGALGGILVIALGWWFGWMSPESSKLTSLAAQKVQDQQTYSNLAIQLDTLRAEAKSVRAASPFLSRFENAVPSTPDAPKLVVELYNLSVADNVQLNSVTDDSLSPSTASNYSTIPVSISIQGGHDAVLAFIAGIYKLPRLITIQSLDVSGSGDINSSSNAPYSASITATAYTTYVAGATSTAAVAPAG